MNYELRLLQKQFVRKERKEIFRVFRG